MFKLLNDKISESIPITALEFEFCKTLFIPKKLRKNQYLLQEGDICKYTAFVNKGITKTYTIDDKGMEHILQFAAEGWWMGDLYSFFTEEPSIYNIEALEDCELLLISKPSWDILLEKVPAFERYFRILVQNNLIATQQRLMGSMAETAETKPIHHPASACLNLLVLAWLLQSQNNSRPWAMTLLHSPVFYHFGRRPRPR